MHGELKCYVLGKGKISTLKSLALLKNHTSCTKPVSKPKEIWKPWSITLSTTEGKLQGFFETIIKCVIDTLEYGKAYLAVLGVL